MESFTDQPPGNATRLKIVGNTFVLHMVESISEATVLAEKCGLGTKNLHSWIEVIYPGPYTSYSSRMQGGDYHKETPLWRATLAQKDYRHARDLAESCGAAVKGLDVVGQHLQDVIDHHGDDSGDIASVYGVVRLESGLEFEN